MARTNDDLYDKLDELLEVLKSKNNGGFSGGKTFTNFDEFQDYLNNQTEKAKRGIREKNSRSEREKRAIYSEQISKLEEEIDSKTQDLKDAYADLSGIDEVNEADKYKEKLKEIKELENDILNSKKEQFETEDKLNESSSFNARVKDGKALVDNIKSIYTSIRSLVDPWAKADAAASKYAKTIGMTKVGMDALRDNTIKNMSSNRLGLKYNISTDELMAAQENYIKGAGRSIRVSDSDQEDIAAMRAVTGERGGEIAAQYDALGISLSSTADRVGKMFSEASKNGLSFEKYSENVSKNIKLAQNYTFKNGTKGLEDMAKKATAIKMDMQQIAQFADKIGTVESSIETSAKLQVLGGPFAQLADPMGMLNEGLNDMEGLQDRIAKMVGTLGHFDKTTGEVTMSSFNKRRVKAAAEATGISYDALMDTAFAQARRGEIEKQINSSTNAQGLSEEMRELIKNSGKIEKGKAGVTIDGKFKSIDELTNKDYDALKKETNSDSDNIRDIAKNLRSLLDIEEGIGKQRDIFQSNIFGLLGKGFKELLVWIGGLAAGIGVVSKIVGSGIGVWNGISGVGKILGGAKGTMSGAANTMGSGVKKGFLTRIGSSIGKGVSNTWNAIKSPFTGGMSGVGNRVGNIGSSIKGSIGKVTSGLTKGVGNLGKRALIKTLGKGGAKTALKLGGKLAGNLAKGGPLGLVAGAVGMIGDGLMDRAISKGKMEKGGVGHHIGSAATGALQGAAIGSILGPIGAAVGGVIGGVHGLLKAGKAKQEKLLDSRAAKLGVEVKGKYGRGKLKEINEGLETGKISKSVRRKLEANGDFALLDQIDKVANVKKEEKEKEKEKKHNRRKELLSTVFSKDKTNFGTANITVGTAMFGGRGVNSLFRGGIVRGQKGELVGNMVSKIKGGITSPFKVIKETGKTLWNAVVKPKKEVGLAGVAKIAPEVPKTFDININGTLKLTSDNGQSIDIIKELKKNPNMLRSLADMIAKEIDYLEKGTNVVKKA